jgi:hypothetical protein
MTKEELKKLTLNKRVEMWKLDLENGFYKKLGYVTKIYNGNHQVQVWFDGEKGPTVVGYRRIELIDTVSKHWL